MNAVKQKFDLVKGEMVCEECGGTGKVVIKTYSKWHKPRKEPCELCKGTGRVDWIQRLTGKETK